MGSIFYGGTNVASFAQAQPLGLFPMSIALAAIEPCAGLGPAGCMENSATTPFGRGYAAYVTQMAVIADVFSMYQLTTVNPPTYAVLAMVSGANIGTVAGATQDSANFPWTTGNVIVRQTGRTPQGMVNVITVTAEGHDTVTSGGARNIHVVAGKITSALVAGLLEFHYAAIGQAEMSISMPEPSPRLAMLAGVIALLGLAAWRARDRLAERTSRLPGTAPPGVAGSARRLRPGGPAAPARAGPSPPAGRYPARAPPPAA
jgi:hypothetical protein